MNYQINKEAESFIIGQLRSLFKECKKLQIKLVENNYTARERFELLKEKRRKLEAIGSEFQAKNLKFNLFFKEDIEKIMKILTDELLKLVPPRKRSGAQWLFSNLSIPTDDLTVEKLNTLSSSRSLPIGRKENCATCAKKINWWNFFSKRTDRDNNLFCSQKCLDKFSFLCCDKCQGEIDPANDSYQYVYESNKRVEIGQRKEKLGIICSYCASTKCLQCSKYYFVPSSRLQKLLPTGNEGKEITKVKNNSHSSVCENCQKSKTDVYQEKDEAEEEEWKWE